MGLADVSLAAFVLISIPARVIRFALVAAITSWIAGSLLRGWSHHARLCLLLALWTAFYAGYFLVMPRS